MKEQIKNFTGAVMVIAFAAAAQTVIYMVENVWFQ